MAFDDLTMTFDPKVPLFPWCRLSDFRAFALARGGSSDVSSGVQVRSDASIFERRARQRSIDLPDLPGRTISFRCDFGRPSEDAGHGVPDHVVAVLAGCPWGTAAERDATYWGLAFSGCRPDDMRDDAALSAMVERARKIAAHSDGAMPRAASSSGELVAGIYGADAIEVDESTRRALGRSTRPVHLDDGRAQDLARIDVFGSRVRVPTVGLAGQPCQILQGGLTMFAFGDKDWPGLAKLSEEAGELVQVIGKLMMTHGAPGHWDGSDLRARLIEEMADQAAAIDFVMDHVLTPEETRVMEDRAHAKRVLFEKWHEEQKERGL